MSSFSMLPMVAIAESPRNPRRHYDEQKLRELADSITAHGVLTPILVRPDADGFEIAAGHRRFRAARLAGLEEIPAVVREMDDTAFLEVLTIENLQRDDLHPMEEAEGFRGLLALPGYDMAGLAERIGKKPSYVAKRLKLLDLVEDARELFWSGAIGLSHAIQVARLSQHQQTDLLRRWPGLGDWQGPWTPAHLANVIRNQFHLFLDKARFDLDSVTLLAGAGSCTQCPKQTGHNRALFDDIDNTATCTDSKCYEQKLDNHIAAILQQRPELLQVSDAWSEKTAAPIVPAGQWREAGKTKRGARDAIIVAGERRGMVLAVLQEPKTFGSPSSKEKENQKARLKAVERERAIRSAAIQQIAAAAAGGGISNDNVTLVLHALACSVSSDSLRWLMKSHGWLRKGEYPSAEAVMAQAGTATDKEELIIELALTRFSFVETWQTPDERKRPSELLDAAKRCGVSIKGIERDIDAVMKPEKKVPRPAAKAVKKRKSK